MRIARLLRRGRTVSAAGPAADHWHLELIRVRADQQRHGIGRAPLDAYLKRVDAAGGAA